MLIERNPKEVAEDFYASTFIPCSAYTIEGKLLFSGGDHYKYGDHALIADLIEKLTQQNPYASLTLSNAEGFNYTAYQSNQLKPQDVFLVVGPYDQHDVQRICDADICYFQNLHLEVQALKPEPCQKSGCAACYSLNVRRAMNFIHAHYQENISLNDVVKVLKLNKSYFCTLFKQETQMTFTQYLNAVRVEKSKRQLLHGDKSILDIALAVGYTSQNYFTIMFKRITQMTPLEFRRKALA